MDTVTSKFFGEESWLSYLSIFLLCIITGLALQWLIFTFLKLGNKRRPAVLIEQLLLNLKAPAKFFLHILFIYGSLTFLELNTFLHKLIEAVIIINSTWMLTALLQALEEVVKHKFGIAGDPPETPLDEPLQFYRSKFCRRS